jgi:AcrR family transcriptional regulator
MSVTPLSRRERIRAETVREIREIAMRQVDEGGPAALSLNAVAKEMGMSGPALYRYFASREDLFAGLLGDAYGQLSAAVKDADEAAARRAPAARLAAIAAGYRDWALAHPRRYALLFGGRPEGFSDPPEAIARIHAAMLVLLGILAAVASDRADTGRPDKLDRQLTAWARERGLSEHFSLPVLRLGVVFWTRMHGIVSLELSAVFADMGIDGATLLDDEVKRTLDAARGGD